MTKPAAADDLGEDFEAEHDAFRRLGKMADEARRAELKAGEEAEVAAAIAKVAKRERKKRTKNGR
jgi:hypothetical protein